MKHLWRNYGLGIFFVVQWIVFTVLYGVFLQLHQQHPSSFWYEFWAGIFENLQSESFQVGEMVIVAAYWIFRGSPQSKDGDERIEAKIDRILRILTSIVEMVRDATERVIDRLDQPRREASRESGRGVGPYVPDAGEDVE